MPFGGCKPPDRGSAADAERADPERLKMEGQKYSVIMIDNEYRVEITVNPVQWHHITMESLPDFRAAQHHVQRTAVAWFFIGGFVFLGIRWLVFGG